METEDDSLESSTISALLSYSQTDRQLNIQTILPRFSSPLKTNFEDRNLWLRFGCALALTDDSPRSALQAFNECLRIDQNDPLPAMLAAKLLLESLDDPNDGLELAQNAIERCQRLVAKSQEKLIKSSEKPNSNLISNGHVDVQNNNHRDINKNHLSTEKSLQDSTPTKTSSSKSSSSSNLEALPQKYCYKNISPLLSKCYLLASIMHAHIYEREPESIKHFKKSNLEASLMYLDLAAKTYSDDYLIYFHKALHEARRKSYSAAIDNLRQAVSLNPNHVPSMQLLVLSLSGLKMFNEALVLCESALHEFEDNLLLLYIKCNLEQCLAETKGYKTALTTAQHLLKCIRKMSPIPHSDEPGDTNQVMEAKQNTNLFADDKESNTKQDLFASELSVWLLVAEIFIKIGSIADAELCISEGSTHVNGALSYQIMYARGLIAKAKNNLMEAKSFFQSCLALNPKHADALQQIAHVHYLLGNHSTAEKFLKDSLEIDNDHYKTWSYLSQVYIETSQHDKATECANRATLLEESSPIISISAISRLILE